MKEINVAVVPVGTAPPEGAELVVIASSEPYVTEENAPKLASDSARYAKKHGVWLLSRRFISAGGLCLCLFSPEGKPMGAQRATHLNLDYRAMRLRRDDRIYVFDTPFGKTALLVDVDVQMPHAVRQAALSGAEIMLSSQFVQPYDFFEDRVMLGAGSAARSNGVPVVSAVGSRGVIVLPDGSETVSPFEEAAISARVFPQSVTAERRKQMLSAGAVLRYHRAEILSVGGEGDVV